MGMPPLTPLVVPFRRGRHFELPPINPLSYIALQYDSPPRNRVKTGGSSPSNVVLPSTRAASSGFKRWGRGRGIGEKATVVRPCCCVSIQECCPFGPKT
jgi:hypothetical protein